MEVNTNGKITDAELDIGAWLIQYERQLAIVAAHGWKDTGHWNNWLDPITGWNYSLDSAITIIQKQGRMDRQLKNADIKLYRT